MTTSYRTEDLLVRLVRPQLEQTRKSIVFLVGSALATQRKKPAPGDTSSAQRVDPPPNDIVIRDPNPLNPSNLGTGSPRPQSAAAATGVPPMNPDIFTEIRAKRPPGQRGVADVNEVVEIVKMQLGETELPDSVSEPNLYQAAFDRLLHIRGPHKTRHAIRRAVWLARTGTSDLPKFDADESGESEKEFREADHDLLGWELTDGARALGAIIAEFPDRFGRYLLTTNYDPTLAVSIRMARGSVVQTVVHGDGNPGQTIADGCHVVYLHGYWHGYDTLHAQAQIGYKRRQLQTFLCELLRDHTVVVLGYGGWDDLFLAAVKRVADHEPNAGLDIIWAFYPTKDDDQSRKVRARLRRAEQRGRIAYYYGVDCHELLPRLLYELRTQGSGQLGKRIDTTKYGKTKLKQVAAKGCWLHIHPHGVRRVIELDPSGAAVVADLRVSGVADGQQPGITCKPRDYRWEVCDRELVIRGPTTMETGQPTSPGHAIRIPTAFDGPANACFDQGVSADEAREAVDEVQKSWLSAWERHWPGHRFAAGKDDFTYHNVGHGVAVHVVPWSEEPESEFSEAGAVRGQWIKLAEFGGAFLVTLHPDGTLTETHAFALRSSWSGRWWIDEDEATKVRQLHIWIKSWHMAIRADAATMVNGAKLYSAKESEPARREGEISFVVAHVVPYAEPAREPGPQSGAGEGEAATAPAADEAPLRRSGSRVKPNPPSKMRTPAAVALRGKR